MLLLTRCSSRVCSGAVSLFLPTNSRYCRNDAYIRFITDAVNEFTNQARRRVCPTTETRTRTMGRQRTTYPLHVLEEYLVMIPGSRLYRPQLGLVATGL